MWVVTCSVACLCGRLSPPAGAAEEEVRPVERSVEARSEDPAFSGMIRCLYLATSYLASGEQLIGRRESTYRMHSL